MFDLFGRRAKAENKANNLNPVTLARIAYEFGEDTIAPYRALWAVGAVEALTMAQRFERIQSDMAAIQRETEAMARV